MPPVIVTASQAPKGSLALPTLMKRRQCRTGVGLPMLSKILVYAYFEINKKHMVYSYNQQL